MGSFDFDYWQELAQNDPAVYFQMREATISGFIETCPDRMRPCLRQMQDRIDVLRACAGSPICATCQMMALIDDCLTDISKRFGEIREKVEAMDKQQA
ncbi:MAG: DUF3135 domain-containing protein [Rhodocyclales bacterium]|nr:DUF3135 domain-containing protein [Rhodocyclales bacterium]